MSERCSQQPAMLCACGAPRPKKTSVRGCAAAGAVLAHPPTPEPPFTLPPVVVSPSARCSNPVTKSASSRYCAGPRISCSRARWAAACRLFARCLRLRPIPAGPGAGQAEPSRADVLLCALLVPHRVWPRRPPACAPPLSGIRVVSSRSRLPSHLLHCRCAALAGAYFRLRLRVGDALVPESLRVGDAAATAHINGQ